MFTMHDSQLDLIMPHTNNNTNPNHNLNLNPNCAVICRTRSLVDADKPA